MGRDDPSMLYTNLAPDAAWRQTLHMVEPWSTTPALASTLRGFSTHMIGADLMHNWHLGVARDVIGSVCMLLLKDKTYYAGSNLAKRFKSMFKELKLFVHEHGFQLRLKKLKRSTFAWKSDSCPELRSTASDAMTFMSYLSQKLCEKPFPGPGFSLLTAMVWHGNQFVKIMGEAELFLKASERVAVYEHGMKFAVSYLQLAIEAQDRSKYLFKLRPKFHYIVHAILEIKDESMCGRNPFYNATFVDEDMVKRCLQMKRKMSARTACVNALKRVRVTTKEALLKHL